MIRRFDLLADYHQIVLLDGQDARAPETVTDTDVERRLGLAPGVVVIHTARNMVVPVTVTLTDAAPAPGDLSAWDHVTECDLTLQSGQLLVAGLTDFLPDAARIAVTPGSYRVRVHHAGLGSLSFDGLEGEDSYAVTLWPGAAEGVAILKQYTGP